MVRRFSQNSWIRDFKYRSWAILRLLLVYRRKDDDFHRRWRRKVMRLGENHKNEHRMRKKLHDPTSWVNRMDQNKDLSSSNCLFWNAAWYWPIFCRDQCDKHQPCTQEWGLLIRYSSKAIPALTWTDPEGFRRTTLTDFKTNVSPTYRPLLPPRKYFWHSFLIKAVLTSGP